MARLSKKGEVRNAVKIALQTGYTHIDCAHIYGNEDEIGQGIKDWGGDRKKIWVTSKVMNTPWKWCPR
jgi:diketogulonate reductase-like aldo/keto reductase